MNRKELEKNWQLCQKEMPAKLMHMSGTDLPDLPLCGNFVQLAGRTIALQNSAVSDLESTEYLEARDALRNLLYIQVEDTWTDINAATTDVSAEERREKLYHQMNDIVKQAYIRLMTEEAKLGCVRIPVQLNHLCDDTKVQSYYGDWQINYSPVLHSCMLTGAKAIEETAKIFSKAWLKNEYCAVITVRFNKEIRQRDYLMIQGSISEFMELVNQYLIEEFNQKKDDEVYRHRFDDDPADW